ncbi:MAG: phosphodiester glycosidase family protein [Actinobacteria bacterium]|nr:phosphodiester glycosidase family protein [Actinomycetota bacterium]
MNPSRHRIGIRASLVALVALLLVGPAAGARTVAGLPIPSGYGVSHSVLADGVDVFTLTRSRRAVVHVARLRAGSTAKLVPVLSTNTVVGGLETTSAMCRRTGCLAAVNGDYFNPIGAPVGGLIVRGEPIRTSRSARPHVAIDDTGAPRLDRPIEIHMTLTVHYPIAVEGAVLLDRTKTFELGNINVERIGGGITVYTSRFGARTRTRGETELVLKNVALRAGNEVPVTIIGAHEGGNAAIPPGGAVLSAKGDAATTLREIWSDVRSGAASQTASIATDTGGAIEALGGKPLLLQSGKIVATGRVRSPQTIVGWTSGGDVLLVTVDGRRPGYSSGMSDREAAALMRAFGARDAIGLDGGGSTTFVIRGRVANRPSDRLVRRGSRNVVVRYPSSRDRVVQQSHERPVATALSIVP